MKKQQATKAPTSELARLADGARLLHYSSLVFDWVREHRHEFMAWLESLLS